MSIGEQVKELRIAAVYKEHFLRELLEKAADTIESLSAKLQTANMERSAEDCRKSVLKIETPKVCIDCPCHFAGESGMVMCGAEKRELLTDDIETFKPDWCPLRELVEDCGGWIPCKVGLPETRNNILICQSNGYVSVGYYSPDGVFLDLNSVPFENVAAWSELPEPYYEP